MHKAAIIDQILRERKGSPQNNQAFAFAPSNIALCKYWGKRDEELNLPLNSSLSISLGSFGAFTTIKLAAESHEACDHYFLNGKEVVQKSSFYQRLHAFLNLFRYPLHICFRVETELNIPLAAGFASSACGFAALTLALNNLYNWRLSKKELSILARLGSGSACRSFWHGFVEWHAGEDPAGMDSFAEPLPTIWTDLNLGLLILSETEKSISSREAMRRTVTTSKFYHEVWPKKSKEDLQIVKAAIAEHDFKLLGETAEANAVLMHACMQQAAPPIDYMLSTTKVMQQKVQALRAQGLPVFFTQDAGPNLQLLFLSENHAALKTFFPEMVVVAPFAASHVEKVILVDEKDRAIGTMEKMAAHISPQLHRAFSIFILRQGKKGLEVLMQKRQRDKYHSAGLWSNSCCGHPRPDEDLMAAAERRLQEELNFLVPLKRVNVIHYETALGNGLYENEIDHILIGFADFDGEIAFNPQEVEACKWIDLEQLKQDLAANPKKYTVWLPQALREIVN